MFNRFIVSAVLLALPALGGVACAPKKHDAFQDVAALVRERSDRTIAWSQTPEDEKAAQQEVATLLAAPLTADQAVQVGFLENRSLQAAFETLGVARADYLQASLPANPVIAGSRRTSDRPGVVANTEIGITQSLLSLLTIAGRRRTADAEFEAAKLRAASEVVRLEADLRTAFYRLQGDLQTVGMLEEIFENLGAASQFARRQRAAGNISELDAARQQALLEEVRVALARARQSVLSRRESLHRLMGLTGDEMEWQTVPKLPELPESDPPLEGLEDLALARRADLLAKRQEVESLARALKVTVHWRWVPLLDLGYDSERDTDGERVSGPNLAIELPIFDWGQGRVERFRSLLRRGQSEMAALAVDIASEVREARGRVVEERRIVANYATTLIPLREQIVAESQKFHNYMLIGIFSLLQARRDETDAYRGYIESVRDYWIARTDLERAAGGRIGVDPAPQERND